MNERREGATGLLKEGDAQRAHRGSDKVDRSDRPVA